MAIQAVKKVHIIGMSDDFEKIARRLQALSIIHIDSIDDIEGLERTEFDDVIKAEGELARVNGALAFLKEYSSAKRGMFAPKPVISTQQLEELNAQEIEDILQKAEEIEQNMLSIRASINQARTVQAMLEPYMGLDTRLDSIKDTKNVCMFLGTVPSSVSTAFEEKMAEYECIIKRVSEQGALNVYFIAAHVSADEEIRNVMRDFGFSEASIPTSDVPGNEYREQQRRIAQLERELENTAKKAREIAKNIDKLEIYSDKCRILIQRYSVKNQAGHTGRTFIVKGWVTEDNVDKLKSELDKISPDIYFAAEDPGEDEDHPIAIKNNRVFTPFEAVTKLYSSPAAGDIDPTVGMAPWFTFLFGMMVSDAAYGIIITIAAFLFIKKAKPTGMVGQIAKILLYGGMGTLFWGIMFGSWFGVEIFPPLMFVPSSEPILMVALCMGLGILHILCGHIMNAYNQIRQGRILDAIFDNLFIMTILIMIPLLILGINWALYGVFAGLAGILLTAGRANKGIKKVTGGFAALYGLTSYLSDVLSYSRLFGLGLSTGVVAMVFNTIAGLMAGSIPGYVAAAVILLVGHVFNIGINTLGAYVHSSRLQYIEYYSKFFQGGGREFLPFGYTTKYINIE